MMNNLYWGMGWGMWFIPLLSILLIYFLVKNNSQTKDGQSAESPMEVLKKRYAKGEITKDQFDEMKKDIS